MILHSAVLPLLVVLPLFAAILIVLLHSVYRRIAEYISIFTTAGLVLLCLIPLLGGIAANKMIVYYVAGWLPPLGISMVADGLSAFLLIIVNALFLLLMIYSIEYAGGYRGKWQYYALAMFMLTGMNGVLVAGDLFNLYVFVEIGVIAAYCLAAFERDAENFEAAFKYAVMGGVSSMLILLAIALVYARTASLNLAAISLAWGNGMTPLGAAVALLMIVGFGLKATLVPFHAWVPDAYASAPAPISAAYSGAMSKVMGVYILVRMLFSVFGFVPALSQALMLLGAVSIIVAVTLALYQWDIKRLLAYHSVSQLGYIVLGIGLGTPLGIIGGLFHLINHSAFKSLLFLNAGSIEYRTGKRNLKEMGGIAKQMPVTGFTSMIASLSIAGIPPLNGFWSKLIIIMACVQAGKFGLAFLAVIGSILTLSSFMKFQRYAFSGFLKDSLKDIREAPLLMTIPVLALALCCIFLGVLLLPGSSANMLDLAVDAVLRGKDYAVMLSGVQR